MHFLSPDRPRISGLPAFLSERNPGGFSIIPALSCHPNNDGTIELSGFFSNGRNRASRKVHNIRAEDFAAFWARWLEDPEATAEKDFGWKPIIEPVFTPAVPINIDDLLGDF